MKQTLDALQKAHTELKEAESNIDFVAYCDANQRIIALLSEFRFKLDTAMEAQMQLTITLDTA